MEQTKYDFKTVADVVSVATEEDAETIASVYKFQEVVEGILDGAQPVASDELEHDVKFVVRVVAAMDRPRFHARFIEYARLVLDGPSADEDAAQAQSDGGLDPSLLS